MAQFFGLIPLNAANFESGAATDGQVLTADGVGGAAFEDATGGGGAVTSEIPVAGAMLVSGAGMSAVNGVYLPDGTHNDRPQYAQVGGAYLLQWQGAWCILIEYGMSPYGSGDDVATPDLATIWENWNGLDPVPSVTAAVDYPSGFYLGADGAGGVAWAQPPAAWEINPSGGRQLPGSTASGGVGAVAEGVDSVAGGAYSHAMGKGAQARHAGSYAASGQLYSAQYARYLHFGFTNNDTPMELLMGEDEQLLIPAQTALAFRTLVAGYCQLNQQAAGYEFRGVVKNDGTTVALVGTITKTVLAEDNVAWDVDMSVDGSTGALIIVVTGSNLGTTWHAVTDASEVYSMKPW